MANLRFKRIPLKSQDGNFVCQNDSSPEGPEKEIWKPIKNFSGYEVSNFGRVRSFWNIDFRPHFISKYPQRILSPNKHPNGFSQCLSVQMKNNQGHLNRKRIHVLVLETFIGPRPSPKAQCCHYDGNASNNHVSNLRWDTCKNNHADMVRHGNSTLGSKNPMSKLNEQQVVEIRERYHQGDSSNQIAKEFNVTSDCILFIVTGQQWKHVGGPIHKSGTATDRCVHKGSKNGMAILNEELVSQIKQKLKNGEKQFHIAKEFGVNPPVIGHIAKGRSWKNVK